jgi:hypothetical protein
MNPLIFTDKMSSIIEQMLPLLGHDLDKKLALLEAYIVVFSEILPDDDDEDSETEES